MRLLLKLIALALAIHFVPKFCHDKTDGFRIPNIHSHFETNPEWVVSKAPTLPLEEILDQPFHYLAAGGQSYAFLSEDGQYVVKFFKHHLRRLPRLIEHLPLFGTLAKKRDATRAKREKKLRRDFGSYKLAFEELAEETGLIFAHLSKGDLPDLKVTVVDKIGIAHTIALGQVEFIVQHQATLAYDHMDPLDLDGKKGALESIVDLITSRCDKGIYDEDAKIHRNFGFYGDRAMLIDVGRLKIDDNRKKARFQKRDLEKATRPLLEKYPELKEHMSGLLAGVFDG